MKLVAASFVLALASLTTAFVHGEILDDDSSASGSISEGNLYKIEGKISPPDVKSLDFYWRTRVMIDGGKKVGFIKEDNTFTVYDLPPGSYLVEVVNPDYFYEPLRVDISSKGKFRARRVNNVQHTQVNTVPYPLKMKPLGKNRYFQKREEWKMTDVLMNPMIMMMILPMLLITVLPKMMNDPETKKEMEQMQQNMNVQNQLPEVSELMANFFGGGGGSSGGSKKKSTRPAARR